MPPTADAEAQKRAAAARAATLVEDGMPLGVGSGSTVAYFIEELGRLAARGMRFTCVSSSERSASQLAAAGVRVVDHHEQRLQLCVDGADEVSPDLALIKGGGGALLREKLVAMAADRFVAIVDESKLVPALGRHPLPVEVVRFLWPDTGRRLTALGLTWELRGGVETPFVTDEGHYILDAHLGGDGIIDDPDTLGRELKQVVGVVEHGLFVHVAGACLVGEADGVRVLGRI